MSRRSGISAKQLREILKKPFYNNDSRGQEGKARINNELTRNSAAKQKRGKQPALVRRAEDQAGMVGIPGPLFVRIIRHIPKGGNAYDDDNLSGGCKQLRDGIAAMLGLKGDSAEDGITFEYAQVKTDIGQAETVIEIYQIQES